MMFRHKILMGLSVCLVLTAGLGLCPGKAMAEDSVISLLPQDTLFAIRFASIEQTQKHVNDFTMAALEMPTGSEFVKIFSSEYQLENLDGIDQTKPVFVIAIGDSELDVNGLTLYPISDEEAFLSHFTLEKGEDGYYSGEKCSLLIRDGYAILVRDDLKKAAGVWLDEKTNPSKFISLQVNEKTDIAVWVPAKSIISRYEEDIKSGISDMLDGLANIPVPGPAGAYQRNIQMLSIAVEWILELSQQVDEVGIEIALSSDGVELKKTARLAEGSPFGDYIKNAKLVDVSSLLSVLTPTSWIAGVINIDPSLYTLVSEPVLQGMAKAGFKMEGMEDIWNLSSKAYNGGFAIDLNVGDSLKKNPVVQEQLVGIKDVDAAQKLLDSMPEMLKKTYSFSIPEESVKPVIKEEKEAGTYKGIPYSNLDISFKVESPEALYTEMYGDMNMSMSYALKDKTMAVTAGCDITKVLDKIVDNAAPDPEAIKWLDNAGDRYIFAMRINLLQMLKFAKMAVEQQMKGINPLAAVVIPDPANNSGITLFSNIGDNNITFRLNVPAKEIKAVQTAVMGGMMMQQK